MLIEIASKLGLKWDLERAIGKHVTDVYIEGEQPLAIEFQCSKCDSTEISERAQTYAEQGVAVFWILGQNFSKNFQKKTRTKIEREIEKLHPTVYLKDKKYSVCRNNPEYHSYQGYNKEYFPDTGQIGLIEDFDVEWHITSFLKNKLTEQNPSLMFRWMIHEDLKEEKQESNINKIFKQSSTPPKNNVNRYPQRKFAQPMVQSKPIWTVKRISTSRKCEQCGKRNIEFIATQYIKPNIELNKTKPLVVEKCEACLVDFKKTFSNAIWKSD